MSRSDVLRIVVGSSLSLAAIAGCSSNDLAVEPAGDDGGGDAQVDSTSTDGGMDTSRDDTNGADTSGADTGDASAVDTNPADTSGGETLTTDTGPRDVMPDVPSDTAGCPSPIGTTRYVDAAAASTGNGTAACPFKTITRALDALGPTLSAPFVVLLAPGTYDAALGERFPFIVPDLITIRGDVSKGTSRAAFVIDGAGILDTTVGVLKATIELHGGLDFVTVKDSSKTAEAILFIYQGTPTLKTMTVQGGTNAISIRAITGAATGPTLTIQDQCLIEKAAKDGILIDPGTSGAPPTVRVVGALIHDNGQDGVHAVKGAVSSPIVDLGTSCTTKAMNAIYCNGRYGVETSVGVTVSAKGCSWDHATPKSGAAPADRDDAVRVDASCDNGAAAGACFK